MKKFEVTKTEYKEFPYDYNGCSYRNKQEVFWVGILDFCGCYDEETYERVYQVFKLIASQPSYESLYYDKIAEKIGIDLAQAELILHILDNADLIEHGISVRGSWQTEYGADVLKFMEESIN